MSMGVKQQLMPVGGIHPPWSTVKNYTRFHDGPTTGLTNYANVSPGSTFVVTDATTQWSGTHPKWGTTSLHPSGVLNGARAPDNASHAIGTDDFLFEWWQWTTTLALEFNSVKIYLDCRAAISGPGASSRLAVYSAAADGSIRVHNGTTDIISAAAGTINTSSNQLISLCRVSNTTTLYIDGVSVGSAGDSTTYLQGPISLSVAVNNGGSNSGWVSEFRFAHGTGAGIYTGNFTIPCGPFPMNCP